jgi:DNA-binding transcriptional regulator YdaS (Cro superfamily)
MPRRKVYTFDGVLDVLGGLKAAAALTGVTPAGVCKWRTQNGGRFPARTHPRIEAELARKGATAPRHLWDFDPPREYDEPKRAAKARVP